MQNLGAKNEVFIGGLPLNTTTGKKECLLFIMCSEEVKAYLTKFGPLLNCRLAFYKKGNLKGFGFAEFQNPADSLKACGKNHTINGK